MGTASMFNRIIHDELDAWAAWLPVVNTLKVGDYGLISDGVFVPAGNVAEFGVTVEVEDGPAASLDFTSAGTTTVRLAGGVQVDALPDAPIDAKLEVRFGSSNSFLVKAAEITCRQMKNVNQAARVLAAAPGWERRFRVVATTYTANDCAIVTTRSENASLELSGKADALKRFELGRAEAGLTVSREQNIGFKTLGRSGVIALRLFKLGLFGGARLLGMAADVEVDDACPAEPQDDL